MLSVTRATTTLARLLDEVERAVPDRIDRHGDVALPGDHEDRRRIVLGIELLEDLEPRAARNIDVENNAGGNDRVGAGQQCAALGEAGRTVSGLREYDRQHLADRRIIVHNEDLAMGRSKLGHLQTIPRGCGLPGTVPAMRFRGGRSAARQSESMIARIDDRAMSPPSPKPNARYRARICLIDEIRTRSKPSAPEGINLRS
jgi:hypothetical protein